MSLAETLLLRSDETEYAMLFGQQTLPAWRRHVVTIVFATFGFGLALTMMAALLGNLFIIPQIWLLAVSLGFVAGSGLSVALYNQPQAGWRLSLGQWLFRLSAAIVAFVLTQLVFIILGIDSRIALVWSGSGYVAYLRQYNVQWWQQLLQRPWLVPALTVIDALFVAIVLTIGLTIGLVIAERWLTHWNKLRARVGD